MANRLALDISMGKDGFDALEATYRNEGLSVGANHMVRLESIFPVYLYLMLHFPT